MNVYKVALAVALIVKSTSPSIPAASLMIRYTYWASKMI